MHPSQPRPQSCPSCGSPRVAMLFFGLPKDINELTPKIEADEIRLGGCDVNEDSPQWHCCACHFEWGITDWAPFLKEERLKLEQKEILKDQEARKRGIMAAQVTEDGWMRCPHCNWRFTINNKFSWDGERHKACGTYIKLINAAEQDAAANP